MNLNGADTAIDAAAVKTIEVLEDPAGIGANTVDLSAVGSAAYTQLTSTLIQAAGGNDELTGSQLDDRIVGGRQADTMNGRDGDDTLVWNNGDGDDEMNGGDGIDTIESNGADVGSAAVDETYTVATVGAARGGSTRLDRAAPAALGIGIVDTESLPGRRPDHRDAVGHRVRGV